MTWLIHDVQVWRVDRVYLEAKNGPWISTQQILGDGGSIWSRPVFWHTPKDGKQLVALLERLGVAGKAARGAAAVAPHVISPAPTPQPPQTAVQPSSSHPVHGIGWAYVAASFGVGIVLAVWASRLHTSRIAGRTSDDGEPIRGLKDAPVAALR